MGLKRSKRAQSLLIRTRSINLFPHKKKKKNLDSSKLKEFADNNSKFDENGGKFSKSVKNAVGEKGEIARYEQFLLFPQSFQKSCTADT